MKIQPVVEYEPADERVEWKSQPADEVGKEYNSFVGFWGRDDLPRSGQPMRDVRG